MFVVVFLQEKPVKIKKRPKIKKKDPPPKKKVSTGWVPDKRGKHVMLYLDLFQTKQR